MGGGESEVGYLDFFSFLFCMCFLLVQSMKNKRVGGGGEEVAGFFCS
jgi:hypothetical protein